MTQMIAVLLALASQDETLDTLLRRFSDDDPSRRDEATRVIIERWKEWKDTDLAKLRKAGEGADGELAARTRDALGTIELRRRLGEKLLRELPEIEKAIRRGTTEFRFDRLFQAAILWKQGTLDEAALRTLAAIATENGWPLDRDQRTCLGFMGQVGVVIPPYASLVAPVLKDADPEERAKAAVLLGAMGAREYAADVAALLKEVDKAPRVATLKSLAAMNARDHVRAVAQQLDPTEAYEIKLAAIESLGRLHASDAYAAKIVPFLLDGSPGVVHAAVESLGHCGARSEAPRVAEILRSDSTGSRGAAAQVLGRMGAHELAGALTGLLKDEACRRVALEALGRMGARDQADAVVPFLKDPDEGVRAEAARALGRMGAADRAPLLLPLVRETSFEVSSKAVHALGDLVTPETAGDVAKLLTSETRVVRGLAAAILGRAGAADRADAIAPLLEEAQPFVRCEAAKALAALAAGKHLKAILPLLQDEFEEVRTDAALSLGRLAETPMTEEERDHLFERLSEATESLTAPARLAAQVALAWHGKGGVAYQRLVLRAMKESAQDFSDALFDGLARTHEKAAFEKLSRPIVLERAVDSIDRLREVLASVGLRLETAEPLAGRVPPGTRTTARRLLQNLWESRSVIPQGDRVRLLGLDESYEFWDARLSGK